MGACHVAMCRVTGLSEPFNKVNHQGHECLLPLLQSILPDPVTSAMHSIQSITHGDDGCMHAKASLACPPRMYGVQKSVSAGSYVLLVHYRTYTPRPRKHEAETRTARGNSPWAHGVLLAGEGRTASCRPAGRPRAQQLPCRACRAQVPDQAPGRVCDPQDPGRSRGNRCKLAAERHRFPVSRTSTDVSCPWFAGSEAQCCLQSTTRLRSWSLVISFRAKLVQDSTPLHVESSGSALRRHVHGAGLRARSQIPQWLREGAKW